jgi:hypothetical protein
MSRAAYSDDLDQWDFIRWRGAVKSALRGKRGQAFLRELIVALDAMPEKRLVPDDLRDAEGDVCALGAVGVARGMNLSMLDPDEPETVADAFSLAEAMAKEIMYENDEGGPWKETPEHRWKRMRQWAERHLLP